MRTLVNTMVTATVLMLGGLKVMNGELTVGLLVAYQSLTGGFTKPLNNFVNFGSPRLPTSQMFTATMGAAEQLA